MAMKTAPVRRATPVRMAALPIGRTGAWRCAPATRLSLLHHQHAWIVYTQPRTPTTHSSLTHALSACTARIRTHSTPSQVDDRSDFEAQAESAESASEAAAVRSAAHPTQSSPSQPSQQPRNNARCQPDSLPSPPPAPEAACAARSARSPAHSMRELRLPLSPEPSVTSPISHHLPPHPISVGPLLLSTPTHARHGSFTHGTHPVPTRACDLCT
jgi:hypothetical protein